MFFVFQIITFELVVANYPYYYDNTRSWQSTYMNEILLTEKEMVFLVF